MKDDTVYLDGARIAGAIRMTDTSPKAFRMAVYPDGREELQGGFFWSCGSETGVDWRALPKVQVNDNGNEIITEETE